MATVKAAHPEAKITTAGETVLKTRPNPTHVEERALDRGNSRTILEHLQHNVDPSISLAPQFWSTNIFCTGEVLS